MKLHILRILREKGPMGWYQLEHTLMARDQRSDSRLMEYLAELKADGIIVERLGDPHAEYELVVREHLVDVSIKEMGQGRPVRRRLYQWPVCGPCWNHLDRPELSVDHRGPMSGPAGPRQQEGHIFEVCCISATRTIMGLYLKWLCPPRKPNLQRYLKLRHDLVLKRDSGGDEDPVLDAMDPAWKEMTEEERDFINALPQIVEES